MSDLPAGWARTTVEDLVDRLQYGYTASASHENTAGPRFLRITDIEDGTIDWNSVPGCSISEYDFLRYELYDGDVVFARTGSIEKTSLVKLPPRAVFASYLIRARPVDIRTSAWLGVFASSLAYREQAQAASAGIGRANINAKNLGKLALSLPPLAEQHRIVEAIESYFTRLDDAVATLERVQRNLTRYRASVLKAAVEGRLVPTEAELARAEGRNYEPGSVLLERVAVTKNAQKLEGDDLAPLPEGWAWTTLGQVAEIKGGITKGQKRRQGVVYREVPYLRVANVQRGFLDLSEMKTIPAAEQEIAELRLVAGDVLFNEGGDRDKLGRGWIWNNEIDECIHQNHVFRARLVEAGIHPKFLSWYANTEGQRYFFAEGKHTTNLASINMTKLRRLPLPVPPRNEQLRIVAAVEESLSLIDDSMGSVERELSRCRTLRQSVLKWAFEGRLVDQDPGDEPASVLLERIKAERAAPAGSRTRRQRKPRASKDVE